MNIVCSSSESTARALPPTVSQCAGGGRAGDGAVRRDSERLGEPSSSPGSHEVVSLADRLRRMNMGFTFLLIIINLHFPFIIHSSWSLMFAQVVVNYCSSHLKCDSFCNTFIET